MGYNSVARKKASLLINALWALNFAKVVHDWRDLTSGAWKRRCRKVVKPASSLFHTIFNLGNGSDDELEVPCSSLWEDEVILMSLGRHPILCNEMKGPCLYWPGQGLLSNHWRQCMGVASVLRTLLFQWGARLGWYWYPCLPLHIWGMSSLSGAAGEGFMNLFMLSNKWRSIYSSSSMIARVLALSTVALLMEFSLE